ncbi:MAG: ATP-binding protein [Deltaproteobacteria bacterium]
MTFRTRLFLAFLAVLLIPLGVLAFGVRREVDRRLTAEYDRRVRALAGVIEDDLRRGSGDVAARLATLRDQLAAENRFRLAAVQDDPAARGWLLDYAGGAMRLAGLALLQVQDSAGRILSSGQFRNEFDRQEPALPAFLAATRDSVALVRVRTAETGLLALARLDSLAVGRRRFSLVGGAALDAARLARADSAGGLAVSLLLPGGDTLRPAASEVVAEIGVPYLDLSREGAPATDTARVVVTQSLAPLEALRRSVDAWFLAALGATGAAAVLAAAWLSRRIGEPLAELARKTETIDLDRLDADFATDRRDEVGALSRLLGEMTARLRQSTARLREAERRATLGDVARQVNHDVKNGLAPIRHVLRHLSRVAAEEPASLPAVFEERRGTLESSVLYLETLARNYARLAPPMEWRACDVNAVVREVARTAESRAPLRLELAPDLPAVTGDELAIRRVLENLVGNAADGLGGRPGGAVTVATSAEHDRAGAVVRVSVADNGRGMTRAELDQAFDDFYTTKEGGTGLGLTIVRRLVQDLGGRLRVETEPGAGTRVIVELPERSPS